jgi:hypothetical protein
MTEPTIPILTPDPREPKLAAWARARIDALRGKVRDMQAIVDAVRGEHPGSNVRIFEKTGLGKTNLPKGSMIEFDSNWGTIKVFHDLKGRICVQGDNTLLVRLEAGNTLTVELEN